MCFEVGHRVKYTPAYDAPRSGAFAIVKEIRHDGTVIIEFDDALGWGPSMRLWCAANHHIESVEPQNVPSSNLPREW